MNNPLFRFYRWISKMRVLDGYIYILRGLLWINYKILADYQSVVFIFSLNITIFRYLDVFELTIRDHRLWDKTNNDLNFPALSLKFTLFQMGFDTAKDAYKRLDNWYKERTNASK